jgi:hypothetical protein
MIQPLITYLRKGDMTPFTVCAIEGIRWLYEGEPNTPEFKPLRVLPFKEQLWVFLTGDYHIKRLH